MGLWGISCIVAADSSPVSNSFAIGERHYRPVSSSKRQYPPPYPAKEIGEQLQLLNQQISALEPKIDMIESRIDHAEGQLQSATDADKDDLRNKIQSLRNKKQLFLSMKQSLLNERQSLRKTEEWLLKFYCQRDTSAMSADAVMQSFPRDSQAKFVQEASSVFVASKGNHCLNCLYNGMKVVKFNQPSAVREFLAMQITDDSALMAEQVILNGIARTMFPVRVSESGAGLTIESKVGNQLREFFTCHEHPALGFTIKQPLLRFGANSGPTGGSSISDGVAYYAVDSQWVPLLCVELKNTPMSPIEQIGQAFASGSNLALRQKHLGLDSSQIAVPLVMTNGHLFSFATASLLDFMPVLHVVTDVLDANDPSDLKVIALMLSKIKVFVKSRAQKIEQCLQQRGAVVAEVPATTFMFDWDKFFVKEKEKIYNRFEPLDSENEALPLLWDVYEALAGVEGAEKALGYCDLQLVGFPSQCCLVFHNLLGRGYRMGVPEDDGDYRLFLDALEALVHQVHACGVIHADLYPSNIMWAKVDGAVRIRIVDWDAATFAGQPFPDKMLRRLDESSPYVYRDQSGTASPKLDAWNLFLLGRLSVAERAALASRDGTLINAAYHDVIAEQIKRYGSVPALHSAFLEWFERFQGTGSYPPQPQQPPQPQLPSSLQIEA